LAAGPAVSLAALPGVKETVAPALVLAVKSIAWEVGAATEYPTGRYETGFFRGMLVGGRVPLPVGRAGFKPVGGRSGVFGRFDSCLFRPFLISEHKLCGALSVPNRCFSGTKCWAIFNC
jgi:hypothetical protein